MAKELRQAHHRWAGIQGRWTREEKARDNLSEQLLLLLKTKESQGVTVPISSRMRLEPHPGVNMPRADRRSEGGWMSCDKTLASATNGETPSKTWRNLGNAPRPWRQRPTFSGARVD